MAQRSQYCHDWRKPEFTTAGLCPNFRRRARTAPPLPIGHCGCPDTNPTPTRTRRATSGRQKTPAKDATTRPASPSVDIIISSIETSSAG